MPVQEILKISVSRLAEIAFSTFYTHKFAVKVQVTVEIDGTWVPGLPTWFNPKPGGSGPKKSLNHMGGMGHACPRNFEN